MVVDQWCVCEEEDGVFGGKIINKNIYLFIFRDRKKNFKQSREINIKTDECMCLLKQQKWSFLGQFSENFVETDMNAINNIH